MTNKIYTAQQMRDAAVDLDWKSPSPFRKLKEHRMYVNMLRYAADTEKENAKLKARLEAVVKECENSKYDLYCPHDDGECTPCSRESECRNCNDVVKTATKVVARILRAAHGEGGAEW